MSNLANRKTYITLAAGIAVGAGAMATVLNGNVVTAAHAENETPVKHISSISSNDMATLRSLDSSFASLAGYVSPSVVHIRSESQLARDGGGQLRSMGGQGTGVIYRADGYIITNDHVVGGFDNVTVITRDGREYKGKVIGAPDSDIAVVKIDAKDLPQAQFGDSGKVKPGQFAMAIGSPFGLENSVTIGHVSGLGRSSMIPDQRLNGYARVYPDLIQTDASINMGNSGGPLVNVEGEVIGINTAIFSETGGSVGIGFAIPANQARLIADLLIEKGKIERGYLGVLPENLKDFQKEEMKLDGGALVGDEPPAGGPAAKAGIQKGDVIVRIGTYAIRNQLDLRNAMLRYAPGSKVRVEYVRDGDRKSAEVTIAELPEQLRVPDTSKAPANPRVRQGIPGNPPQFHREFGNPDDMLKEFERFFGPDSEQMKRLRERIKDGKSVEPNIEVRRPRLGVGVSSVTDAMRKQFEIPAGVEGAVVTSVQPGSTAERLGLEAGDVIQSFGGKTIKNAEELTTAVTDAEAGNRLSLRAVRFSKGVRSEKSFDVTLR